MEDGDFHPIYKRRKGKKVRVVKSEVEMSPPPPPPPPLSSSSVGVVVCSVCNVQSHERHEHTLLHSTCLSSGLPLVFRCASSWEHVLQSGQERCSTCRAELEYRCVLCGLWQLLKTDPATAFGLHHRRFHDEPLFVETQQRKHLKRGKRRRQAADADYRAVDDEDDEEDEDDDLRSSDSEADLEIFPPRPMHHFEKSALPQISPLMHLQEAVIEILGRSYGRLVTEKWVINQLLRSGWGARFGDFLDLQEPYDIAQCYTPLLLGKLVRSLFTGAHESSTFIVTSRSRNRVYISLAGEDYLDRSELEALYDQLKPVRLVGGAPRIVNLELEKQFAEHDVNAHKLTSWRKGDAEYRHMHAFPTELALDVVARTLRLNFKGRMLRLDDATMGEEKGDEMCVVAVEGEDDWEEEGDPKEEPHSFIKTHLDGSLELCSYRLLFLGSMSAEDRQMGNEQSILQLLREFSVGPTSATYGLCLVALYGRLMLARTREVLQQQMFKVCLAELHCNESQMCLFGDAVCALNSRFRCNFVRAPLPALLKWDYEHVQSRAPSDTSVLSSQMRGEDPSLAPIAIYRRALRGHMEQWLLMRVDGQVLSVGGMHEKEPPSRMFFRVKLPIDTDHLFTCLYSTLNVVGLGEDGGLTVMLNGDRRVRLELSALTDDVDPQTQLSLERWNEQGAVLVVQGGFLMGLGSLVCVNKGEGGKQKRKVLILRVFLDNNLVGETCLRISSRFQIREAVEALNADLLWSPENLLELAKEPEDASMVRVHANAADEAQSIVVFPEVARFVTEIGWNMKYGSHENKDLKFGADELVNVSAMLQRILEEEVFSIAADILDDQKKD